MNHFFANNRRLPAAEADSLFRKEQSEVDLKNAVELLKRLSPAQAKRRDFIENLKKMSYWKRDVVEQKIEELKRRIVCDSEQKSKKVFTNKRSEVLLAGRRKNKKVEESLAEWGLRKERRVAQLAESLTPTFKPELNSNSLRMTATRSNTLSKSWSRSRVLHGSQEVVAEEQSRRKTKLEAAAGWTARQGTRVQCSSTLSQRTGFPNGSGFPGVETPTAKAQNPHFAEMSSNIYRPTTLTFLAANLA